jgi:pimeloyl-ACP methyl ester carboxylesterase
LRALASAATAARSGERAYRLQASQPYAIGSVTLKLTDPSRTIGSAPRSFDTIIRYPKPVAGQAPGPFPLIVFGHGFSVTPDPYSPLLDAWTQAGFVVAAPVFPLENANAPGGPDEKDLDNQPADMSLVISSLTTGSAGRQGGLAGMIDSRHIAVTGQSDGGDTALAAAYDPRHRDPRIGAAMILSGAEDPFAAQFSMPSSGPPLLAVQGTADTINPPDMTYAFYNQAAPPKFLLRLIGAGHQPPYTEPGAELTAVARTTIAFLDGVFKGRPSRLKRLLAAGTAGDNSQLTGNQ